jgi:hypothetical protein
MEVAELLDNAHEAGLTVWLDGSDVFIEGDPTPEALAAIEVLKEHTAEVVTYLRQSSGGHPPPLDRPLENEEELRRWMDWTADPKKFARWLDWAMTHESTNY